MKRRRRMSERLVVRVAAAFIFATLSASGARAQGSPLPDLTGTYLADDGGVYYVQQSGNVVWWAGFSLDAGLPVGQVFHRGLAFTNVFKGVVQSDNTVAGEWADVTRGAILNTGTLTLQVAPATGGSGFQLTALSKTGGFGASQWTPTDPISDEPSMTDRFVRVAKGADPESLSANGLQSLRDETVFYGRVLSYHLNGGVKEEVPHFVDTKPDRSYNTFICDTNNDHDLEVNIAVDRNRFESTFLTYGWGEFDIAVATEKLYDNTVQGPAGLYPNEGYIHAEGLMYGHHASCDGGAEEVLFPGWADKGGNSILINGQAIDAAEYPDNLQPNYGFDVNTQQYYQDGVLADNLALVPGKEIRITGSLILDCGHWDWDTLNDSCHFDTYANDNESQNEEIHPIYAIDIINPPLGTGNYQARQNLTGAWGTEDGGTFYVRQIGNKVWILGLSRTREALELPDLPSPQIPTYANVFQGTISANPDGTELILGNGETIPYASATGGFAYAATIVVGTNRKAMTPNACSPYCPSALPAQFNKLYEPPDNTPPQSTLTIGAPKYPASAAQPFVASGTSFSVSATDNGSGVQNIWYRTFAQGGTAPTYTPVVGSTVNFVLSGADGAYEVDTYATDNAGNDESSRNTLVYLDNTPPVATIVSPAATQYGRSTPLMLTYSVSDGSGSGVAGFTPKMDGLTAAQFGASLQSGQTIYLYSMSLSPHTFSLDSVDNLNNAGTNSVTFTITVTPDSLLGDVNNLVALGCIDNISQSLTAKIGAAKSLIAKGQIQAAINTLAALINEVQAQAAKHISTSCHDPSGRPFDPVQLLLGDAEYLQATLASQVKANPIMGSVLSSTNTAIVGTTVSLLTPSKSVAETAITDSSGFYYFADTTGLTRGSNYTLKVTVPKGYKGVTPASQTFTWSAISVLTNFVVQ